MQKDGTKILGHILVIKVRMLPASSQTIRCEQNPPLPAFCTVAPMILGGLGTAKKDGGLDSGGIADEGYQERTKAAWAALLCPC